MFSTTNDTYMTRRQQFSNQFSLQVLVQPNQSWTKQRGEASGKLMLSTYCCKRRNPSVFACLHSLHTHFFCLSSISRAEPRMLGPASCTAGKFLGTANLSVRFGKPTESHCARISSHLQPLIPISGGRQSKFAAVHLVTAPPLSSTGIHCRSALRELRSNLSSLQCPSMGVQGDSSHRNFFR